MKKCVIVSNFDNKTYKYNHQLVTWICKSRRFYASSLICLLSDIGSDNAHLSVLWASPPPDFWAIYILATTNCIMCHLWFILSKNNGKYVKFFPAMKKSEIHKHFNSGLKDVISPKDENNILDPTVSWNVGLWVTNVIRTMS